MSEVKRPEIQASQLAKRLAMDRFHQWGARNLIKVTNPGPALDQVQGYVGFMQAIAGKTPEAISRTLGLRASDLAGGAMIYRLDRLPHDGEYEVRGYTTLPDGVPAPAGKTEDAAGYRVGTGALQYVLTKPVPATLLGQLAPGQRFDLRTIRVPGASSTLFSGAEWWRANQMKYPNSADLGELDASFAPAAQGFVRALRAAGASVVVSSTRRNRLRAYLMHYSWRVAEGEVAPHEVPFEPEVAILWDHGDLAASRKGAAEMVDLFGIVHRPSLVSNHILGHAVDMNISWTQPITIKDARGRDVLLDRPRDGASNTDLHAIGAGYGVRKLLSDPPHWSSNGR